MNGTATISKNTRFDWGVMAVIAGCTFWIATEIAGLRAAVLNSVEQARRNEARITALERTSIERGPLIDALREAIRENR